MGVWVCEREIKTKVQKERKTANVDRDLRQSREKGSICEGVRV